MILRGGRFHESAELSPTQTCHRLRPSPGFSVVVHALCSTRRPPAWVPNSSRRYRSRRKCDGEPAKGTVTPSCAAEWCNNRTVSTRARRRQAMLNHHTTFSLRSRKQSQLYIATCRGLIMREGLFDQASRAGPARGQYNGHQHRVCSTVTPQDGVPTHSRECGPTGASFSSKTSSASSGDGDSPYPQSMIEKAMRSRGWL
mmetsp:Transcript_3373/g.8102  ORF Transcript_3373/g.8102 Transcript_3373/m.8102 type:complete len:200 (-) Transcript_3373:197-796(-)